LRVRDAPRAPDQDRSARDRAHRAHSRPPTNQLPGRDIVPNRSTRFAPIRPMSAGASRPKNEPPDRGTSTPTRCTASSITPSGPVGPRERARSTDRKMRRVMHDYG
jgi:hypothetical protein